MESAAKIFFSSPRFAVAGASQDSQKFGFQGSPNGDTYSIVKTSADQGVCN